MTGPCPMAGNKTLKPVIDERMIHPLRSIIHRDLLHTMRTNRLRPCRDRPLVRWRARHIPLFSLGTPYTLP